MKMKNSKLKISEFEKYSLTKKFQTLIKGGLTDGGWDPNDQDGDGNPDDPGNPGGPGGTTMSVPITTTPTLDNTKPIPVIIKNN